MTAMSHKLDAVLEEGLRPDATFMKSRNGEKWGYIDEFEHERGHAKCVFETDEEGSFLSMNLFCEEELDNDSQDVLDIINLMNGIQQQLTFFQNPASGKVHARREFIVEGRTPEAIKEMVFERYKRMQDIFDDLMWALDWKQKTGGNHKALFEALAKRETQREKKRDRRRGGDDFDPAFH